MNTVYRMAAVMLAVLTVVSCREKVEPDQPDPEIIFSSSNPDPVFTSKGGNMVISFTSAAEWTARVDKSWCTVNPARGEAGECAVTVYAGENFTYGERSFVLTVRSGSLEEKITFIQIQNDAIVIAEEEYRVMAAGDTLEFAVNANVDFEVVVPSDCGWIRYEDPTKALEEFPVKLIVDPREDDSYDHRQAVVSFISDSIEQTLTVIQFGRQDPSVLRITHQSEVFGLPDVSGLNFLYGTVFWGDGMSEDYVQGLSHTYSPAAQYTVVMDVPGAEEFTLEDIRGVTDLDLTEF